jgi:hypothetical protein
VTLQPGKIFLKVALDAAPYDKLLRVVLVLLDGNKALFGENPHVAVFLSFSSSRREEEEKAGG